MLSTEKITHAKFVCLADNLKTHSNENFSGKIEVKTAKGAKWSIYYRLGRLIWISGGTHPCRRWYRHLRSHCPHLNAQSIRLREGNELPEIWDYHILKVLTKRQQISSEQAIGIIKGMITESLFDLIQQIGGKTFSSRSNEIPDTLKNPITLLKVQEIMIETLQSWQTWCKSGLAAVSPNFAPQIKQAEQIRQQVSTPVYNNLIKLIDGNHTLRDIAVASHKDLLVMMLVITPQIRQGSIGLIKVPDLPLKLAPAEQKCQGNSAALNSNKPLIACIDDSPQIGHLMEKIMTKAGYRFISIQDPVNALTTLIEYKPDLIFLDLIMPIANGYEICSQLRRVEHFKETPVIILTSSDRVVDKLRAKMVKASGFLSKPVNTKQVTAVVRKYLSASNLKQQPQQHAVTSMLKAPLKAQA